MFSLSVPSQTAFPVLFPAFLHSSLSSFYHWKFCLMSLSSVHICLGQRLSLWCSLRMQEKEVATVCLYRIPWNVTGKSTVIVTKFRFASTWPALPCENFNGLETQKALLQVVLWSRRNTSMLHSSCLMEVS